MHRNILRLLGLLDTKQGSLKKISNYLREATTKWKRIQFHRNVECGRNENNLVTIAVSYLSPLSATERSHHLDRCFFQQNPSFRNALIWFVQSRTFTKLAIKPTVESSDKYCLPSCDLGPWRLNIWMQSPGVKNWSIWFLCIHGSMYASLYVLAQGRTNHTYLEGQPPRQKWPWGFAVSSVSKKRVHGFVRRFSRKQKGNSVEPFPYGCEKLFFEWRRFMLRSLKRPVQSWQGVITVGRWIIPAAQ